MSSLYSLLPSFGVITHVSILHVSFYSFFLLSIIGVSEPELFNKPKIKYLLHQAWALNPLRMSYQIKVIRYMKHRIFIRVSKSAFILLTRMAASVRPVRAVLNINEDRKLLESLERWNWILSIKLPRTVLLFLALAYF